MWLCKYNEMKHVMELIKFIFSDFFIWLGFVIILAVALDGLADIIQAIKK